MMKVLSVLLCVFGITLASADPQPPAVAAAAGAAPPSVLARRLRGGTADDPNEITTEGVLPEAVVRTAVETADDKTEQSSTAEAPVVEPEVKTISASSGPDAAAADRRRLLGEFLGKVKQFVGSVKKGIANVAYAAGLNNVGNHMWNKGHKLHSHAGKLCGGPCY
ncbi:unnamed protein product [Vitrella brassicaformis CCMP3155]|uniref:RxLR effector protein n=1 Tax=Vitrella brassicaformis (strain CCMP3155) TaxID=1169540 RepID=A0A0G4EWW5_VITBC|nr:unnamed protein product [Vitrella brassicaformis CCMP3155]|eukprot:CEM03482.1 unnamed protein product [Vitrella brassicaformis CCMP3155]